MFFIVKTNRTSDNNIHFFKKPVHDPFNTVGAMVLVQSYFSIVITHPLLKFLIKHVIYSHHRVFVWEYHDSKKSQM